MEFDHEVPVTGSPEASSRAPVENENRLGDENRNGSREVPLAITGGEEIRLPKLFSEQADEAPDDTLVEEAPEDEDDYEDDAIASDDGPEIDDEEWDEEDDPDLVVDDDGNAQAPHRQGKVALPKKTKAAPSQSKVEALPAPASLTPDQRFLILDTWLRSKLPAVDFAPMVGVSPKTLYLWKKRYEEHSIAGLEDRPKGAPGGSKLPTATRRAIVTMRTEHPDWGEDRIHAMLLRTAGFYASASAVSRVLHEEGMIETAPPKVEPHGMEPKRFERATPNQLWQTDLFTFMLKRENRRVHFVAFMDDHSRFITGYGLHATASGAMVRETLEVAIANYGAPEEILTDNGTQYHTWRGKSEFAKLLERRGIKQIVARPHRPQTLGKIERFWKTLWNELVGATIFQGMDDARKRLGLFIDGYNFHRTHQGIDNAVPADRFFSAAPQVYEALKARVAKNSLELALNGTPRKNLYLTGVVGDSTVSIHKEGDKVIMTGQGVREEVDLKAVGKMAAPGETAHMPDPVAPHGAQPDHPGTQDDEFLPAPGTSPLDGALSKLKGALGGEA